MTLRSSAALAAVGLAAHAVPVLAREMSADRPDKTESPYSVDKGRYQFEADVANLVFNEGASEFLFGFVNAKYGIATNADVQAIYTPARRTAQGGAATWGMSDLTLRLKYNFFGNDAGEHSLGVIGFVTLPTERSYGGPAPESRRPGAGFSLPYATSLGSYDVGAMLHADLGPEPHFASMMTVGHELWGDLGGYAEFFNLMPEFSTVGWQATADFGLTYGVSPDLQLDANAHFGLTEASDRLQLFSGFTWRL